MSVSRESTPSIRICVAEDDGDLRRTLIQMLAVLGHHVVADVENGEQLIEACAQHELDLVLADLDMPVLDGLAAADYLARSCKVPVILLSGHPDVKHVVVENEPVVTCLQKPINLAQLERAVLDAVRPSSS